MRPEVVAISRFKATCLELFRKVKRTGRPIVVTRHGEPVGMVVPPPGPERPAGWLGSFAETGRITGDVIAPASDAEDWQALR